MSLGFAQFGFDGLRRSGILPFGGFSQWRANGVPTMRTVFFGWIPSTYTFMSRAQAVECRPD